ncbi:hypothetical protein V7152_14815 [Neobacillus drentensis]|uniref:hypothetical protein n=1 Tax=Neobacillus drentensis TaxID=220684 RepID=UPI002FFE2ABE
MKKVLLSKAEVEALESALEVNSGEKAGVVHWHSQNLWDGNRAPLNDLDLDTVCTALYVGYDIEPSPEDKVRAFYESYPSGGCSRDTIEQVLGILNIQIPGINF